MKHKKALITLAMTLALLGAFTLGASASSTLQSIAAYLNPGITIKYEGEAQTMTDASGARVYPITYNGSTYLPVRAISNILGVDVDWEQATQTVLLGKSTAGTDLIANFEPYTDHIREIDYRGSMATEFLQDSDKQTVKIGGETVSHWLSLRTDYFDDESLECSFNLGGKYTALTFKTYSERDMKLTVKGDNGSVLGKFELKGGQIPQTLTIDLFNTTQLTFQCEKVSSGEYPADGTMYDTYIYNTILT